jgi:hypothetical protein
LINAYYLSTGVNMPENEKIPQYPGNGIVGSRIIDLTSDGQRIGPQRFSVSGDLTLRIVFGGRAKEKEANSSMHVQLKVNGAEFASAASKDFGIEFSGETALAVKTGVVYTLEMYQSPKHCTSDGTWIRGYIAIPDYKQAAATDPIAEG